MNTTWKKRLTRFGSMALLLAMLTAVGCQEEKPVGLPEGDTTAPEITAGENEPEESVPAPIVNENAEELTEPETTEAEETPAPAESEPVESSEETTAAETKPADTTGAFNVGTVGETTADRLTGNFINMLTGLPASEEIYYQRPVAVMINNLKKSTPQIGISQADVMYECIVEGGITRLMMLVSDYEALGTVGSVRSSREYYLDFAANHDAIYVHAGGSNQAYVEIKARKINNLDGVNMYVPDMFYRDQERVRTMGYEHSLMTDGPRIANGIAFKKYRTEIRDTYTSSFQFVDYNSEPVALNGENANHVVITYNSSHFPQYIYYPSSNTYKRWQFNGVEHIDGANGQQLEFTNLLILCLPHTYTGDAYGHMDVSSTGKGDGYYVYGGKVMPIKWSKASEDTPMKLTNTDGSQLYLNCGKTMVNIVSDTMMKTLQFNAEQ